MKFPSPKDGLVVGSQKMVIEGPLGILEIILNLRYPEANVLLEPRVTCPGSKPEAGVNIQAAGCRHGLKVTWRSLILDGLC